jgi:hypothetical protein
MKKLLLATLLPLLITNFVHAQKLKLDDEWKPGKLLLSSGEIISGYLAMSYTSESIQITDGRTMRSYDASIVDYFEIQERPTKVKYYLCLPALERNGLKKHRIFEMLYEGGLALLARDKMDQHVVTSYDATGSPYSYTIDVVITDYYYVSNDPVVKPLPKSLTQVIDEIFKGNKDEMQSFIDENHLTYNQKESMIALFAEYERTAM